MDMEDKAPSVTSLFLAPDLPWTKHDQHVGNCYARGAKFD